jgi:competence protein ComEC
MSVKFHFLDVGDGDCTIIDFPKRVFRQSGQEIADRMMMVDIHHHDDHDTYVHITDYYKKNFKDTNGYVRPLHRYVVSHPHMDHMKGLSHLFEHIPIYNVWDIQHEFTPEKSGDKWEQYKDWLLYEALRSKTSGDPTVLNHLDETTPALYWNEDDIDILSPSKELLRFAHYKDDGSKRTAEEIGQVLNNISYVLLVRINGLKVVLAGDAEPKCWEYILENHSEKIKNIDILKAPHHGRESAFHEEAVKLMNPKHIIFSVSEDCEHTVPEKYIKAAPDATIYQTCDYGTLVFDCDFDGNITWTVA